MQHNGGNGKQYKENSSETHRNYPDILAGEWRWQDKAAEHSSDKDTNNNIQTFFNSLRPSDAYMRQ